MTYLLKIKDNSKLAKSFLEFAKSLDFVEFVEPDKIPNKTTLKAMAEAEKGKLKSFKSVKDLMKDLNS